MRTLFASLLLLLVNGCANCKTAAPSAGLGVTKQQVLGVPQQQVSQLTNTALALLRSQEGVRLQSGAFAPTVGTYDPAKPIRYWTEAGRGGAKLHIQIPTTEPSSYSYVTFIYDVPTGQAVRVSYTTIH